MKAKNPFYQFTASDTNKRDLNLKCRQDLKNAELDKIVLFCYNKVKYFLGGTVYEHFKV